MAEYQVTYWRDIPATVTAREGRGHTVRVELPGRFQEAIDELAMRLALTGTDAYLEHWRRGPWQDRPGSPDEVARAVAAELDAEHSPERLRRMLVDAGQ